MFDEEGNREYKFAHLGRDHRGRKLRNSKVGVPDRVYQAAGTTDGDVFVGDIDCDQKTLERLGITCIVNAQPVGAAKPQYKGMQHCRFPISDLAKLPADYKVGTLDGVKRALNPVLDFIESRTQEGKNVLIQCKAGSQQAGACAVAWYMYAEALSLEDALAEAQNLRRRIYLNQGLTKTLETFEAALEQDTDQVFREKCDAQADLKAMQKVLFH